MTIEERLKQIIGEQTFAVVALQTRVEELTAENAKLKETETAGRSSLDGMPSPKPVKR